MCGAQGCILHAHHDEDHTDGERTWPKGKTRRGTSNSNDRGNAAARRRRKQRLVEEFGDGETCPCYRCGRALSVSMVEADRKVPGILGGTYRWENLRPACGDCNKITGNAVSKMLRDKVRRPTIIRLHREGLI
ncbi:HNH endonuclease [Microbacterium phage DelaGarza]|nr:HNH endonuclease [Microbacterium phage DelaGarza]